MKVLLTGGAGRLGRALQEAFLSNSIEYSSPTKKELDVTDLEKIKRCVEETKPDAVIHAAAMTDIRQCEINWQQAELVNVKGTYNIATVCKLECCKMIHISTACVFDGENAPFVESSKPGPKNFYAMTKCAAEWIVRSVDPVHLVVRTNFVPREKWHYPRAFTDRYGTYLFADDVARAICKTIAQPIEGVLHICGSKRMSMFELAKITTPEVEPMTLNDYKGPPLTRDMSLSSERIAPFDLTY